MQIKVQKELDKRMNFRCDCVRGCVCQGVRVGYVNINMSAHAMIYISLVLVFLVFSCESRTYTTS